MQGDTLADAVTQENAPAKPEYWQSVTIDGRVSNVNYGSKEEFERLLRECAVEAVTTNPRPGKPVRYFFRCVHCNDESFTNKMRLNFHRIRSQCPNVKDDAGNPKYLLPYPDQGRGQGKMSEMMRRGKEVDVEAIVNRSKMLQSLGKPPKVPLKDKGNGEAAPAGKGSKGAEQGASVWHLEAGTSAQDRKECTEGVAGKRQRSEGKQATTATEIETGLSKKQLCPSSKRESNRLKGGIGVDITEKAASQQFNTETVPEGGK